MTIDRIQGSLFPDQIPKKREDVSRSEEKNKTSRDRLEISDQAKVLQEGNSLLEMVKSHLSSVSEIRQTKVDDIKGKVASHYYDDEKVISEIADQLSKSEELVSALANQNREATQVSPNELKKLSVIFNRVDRKFYDSIEILDKIAGKILKDAQGNS